MSPFWLLREIPISLARTSTTYTFDKFLISVHWKIICGLPFKLLQFETTNPISQKDTRDRMCWNLMWNTKCRKNLLGQVASQEDMDRWRFRSVPFFWLGLCVQSNQSFIFRWFCVLFTNSLGWFEPQRGFLVNILIDLTVLNTFPLLSTIFGRKGLQMLV